MDIIYKTTSGVAKRNNNLIGKHVLFFLASLIMYVSVFPMPCHRLLCVHACPQTKAIK